MIAVPKSSESVAVNAAAAAVSGSAPAAPPIVDHATGMPASSASCTCPTLQCEIVGFDKADKAYEADYI